MLFLLISGDRFGFCSIVLIVLFLWHVLYMIIRKCSNFLFNIYKKIKK